jgi:hypothetical protein
MCLDYDSSYCIDCALASVAVTGALFWYIQSNWGLDLVGLCLGFGSSDYGYED